MNYNVSCQTCKHGVLSLRYTDRYLCINSESPEYQQHKKKCEKCGKFEECK